MKKLMIVMCVAACGAFAAHHHVPGGASDDIYATDLYSGFDGMEDMPKVEKKTPSWFLWTSRDTPAEQLAYAKEQREAGSRRAARRACDALVRQWPAAKEAVEAQMLLAQIYETDYQDYNSAFEEYEYLLNFYSSDVDYLALNEHLYKLVNLMIKEKSSFLGLTFTSAIEMRQHYETIVRRAPGAPYAPEAMLRIAALREERQQIEESIAVYGSIEAKFPGTSEARTAIYRNARNRMDLTRRHAYNLARCTDTANYLRKIIRQTPDLNEIDQIKEWLMELNGYLGEDAYERAKFYDSHRRTTHAAIASWEQFLKEHPDSRHAEEIKQRITELKSKE